MNFLEIYFILLIVVVIGAWIWTRKIKREIAEVESYIQEALNKVMFMHIEHHDNLVFAYNALNKEFICQGNDLDDLNVQFGKRFPDRRGIIVEPEGTVNVL